MTVADYIAYFRLLATQHNALQHDPLSETPGGEEAHCAFTIFDQTEVVTGKLRARLGAGPALHLHLYDWDLSDNNAYDVRRNYQGGFLVTVKEGRTEGPDVHECYAKAETIALDIVARLRYDLLNTPNAPGNPFYQIDFSQLRATSAGPLWDQRYGWFVTFPFSFPMPGMPDRARVAAAFSTGEEDGLYLGDYLLLLGDSVLILT